jgi:hypothetical protein
VSDSRYGTAVWSSDAWRQLAVSWLDVQLGAAGVERTGEVTQPHLRPWGTVLKAPTTRGPVWLKAPGPDTAFEVALYRLLSRVVPDWILPPIAVDVERGLVVLPDGGQTLGDRLDDTDLIEALAAVLPQYGQLQRDLIPHVDSLLSIGIADMRAEIMPVRFDEAMEAVGRYVHQYGDEADRQTHRRAVAMRDTFGSWCERLAASSVPPSLDHNDLHAWNVFLAPDGRARFYDWGDAVVAHPFASMLVGLGVLRYQLGVGADDPAVLRLRDAYLEAYSDIAPHANLVDDLELACWVGKIARALTWERALRAQGHDDAGEFAKAPLQAIEYLLSDTWITTV